MDCPEGSGHPRGVVADVFIVGGAAMALAYDAARVTRDVDAMFKPHGIVHEEAMQVANDLGLPAGGSTSRQAPCISGKDDADKRRVFDHPRAARHGRLTTSHLRDEGTRGQNARHRRSSPARRHRRSGISRRGPANMRELLPGRTRIPEIRRRAPRTIRLTTTASGICPARILPR